MRVEGIKIDDAVRKTTCVHPVEILHNAICKHGRQNQAMRIAKINILTTKPSCLPQTRTRRLDVHPAFQLELLHHHLSPPPRLPSYRSFPPSGLMVPRNMNVRPTCHQKGPACHLLLSDHVHNNSASLSGSFLPHKPYPTTNSSHPLRHHPRISCVDCHGARKLQPRWVSTTSDLANSHVLDKS